MATLRTPRHRYHWNVLDAHRLGCHVHVPGDHLRKVGEVFHRHNGWYAIADGGAPLFGPFIGAAAAEAALMAYDRVEHGG